MKSHNASPREPIESDAVQPRELLGRYAVEVNDIGYAELATLAGASVGLAFDARVSVVPRCADRADAHPAVAIVKSRKVSPEPGLLIVDVSTVVAWTIPALATAERISGITAEPASA